MLCEGAEEIICATDAGREGELIFRYILSLCNCEDKHIRRLWLNSLTPDAILTAFKDLRDGHDYDSLYAAARCRSESDWIVGLNSTRYYTVRHGRIGGGGDRVLWTIGRVQTPVLAMIVERDDTILQFRPQPFWELTTHYREVVFKYTGKRFEKIEKAQSLLEKITDQPFEIISIAAKKKRELPPQLFDLTTLQREVNKSHGLSAADTLTATQNLYEKKLVTYPRTDSRYLSEDMKPRIPEILEQLKAVRPDQIAQLNLAKLAFSKRIIDDKKVTDHHAIIPTGVVPRSLEANEQLVYDTITTQFIAVFYPICIKNITTVKGASNQVKFQAKGTQIVEAGWTALFPKKRNNRRPPMTRLCRLSRKVKAVRMSRFYEKERLNHPIILPKTHFLVRWRLPVNLSKMIPYGKPSKNEASELLQLERPLSKRYSVATISDVRRSSYAVPIWGAA